jgi:hypothetical protein
LADIPSSLKPAMAKRRIMVHNIPRVNLHTNLVREPSVLNTVANAVLHVAIHDFVGANGSQLDVVLSDELEGPT